MITGEPATLRVEGMANLRDLGGLPLERGGVTRYGRLLRGDSPHGLTPAGRDALVGSGLREVVDLRTASERDSRPSPLLDVGTVRCVPAPIFRDEDDFPEGLVTAADVYGWWLRALGPAVAAAMTAVADAETAPVLVHCHAGKDRTGVVVALVLLLAGVDAGAIADDYAQSGVQLAEMLRTDRVSAVEEGMDEVRAERLFTVRREAMVETVETINAEHGGAARLLRNLGVDQRRIGRLSGLMVAPQWP